MQFTQIPPPDYLKNVVRYCWALDSSGSNVSGGDTADSKVFRAMADGCPGIIFQHPAEGTFHKDNQPLSEIFLYGQSTQYAELSLTGKFNAIGICFYPNALKSVFGLKAEELTDSCMDLNGMAKQQGFSLAEQLSDARPAGEQLRILANYLFIQSGNNSRVTDEPMQYALSQIIHSKGSLSLKTLQDTLQVTERSFERKFKEWVGISPKLFSRICRFQASLTQLRNNDYNKLSDIAYDNDYADQSHLIRSFKEFAGISPYQYQKQYNEVVENLSERIK